MPVKDGDQPRRRACAIPSARLADRAAGVLLASMACVAPGPSGASAGELGLAARHERDAGIESHPAVVFTADFEEADVPTVLAAWEDYKNPERMSLTDDVHAASGGVQSLFMDGSADMYRRLLPGHARLHVRFYAKLEDECSEVHHWVWMGGHEPSTAWPWPRAGERPAGDERWSTGIEPGGSAWSWDFYTYWKDMRGNPGGPQYWGNTFSGRPSPWPVAKDRWTCVELMVVMNDPVTASNGEQAFWIDGERKAHLGPGFPRGEWIWDGFYPDPTGEPFEGFQWRTVPELAINYLWLEHYVDTDPACGVWFDDVVVATEYVGPAGVRALLRGDAAGLRAGDPECGPTRLPLASSDVLAHVPVGSASWRLPLDPAPGLSVYELEPEAGCPPETLRLGKSGAELVISWE